MRTILDNGLKEGATVREVMDALRIALPEAIGKARAENIARTEATTAFNQGRLEAFRETKGFVGAVEFMAITDARTTPICMERDGLVLAIDDPRLPDNTPPLHYMCRSILSPVSEFELEDLGGQGYLDKQRDKLEKLPPPLKGFGNEPGLEGGRPPGQPPVVRTPRGPKGVAGASQHPMQVEGEAGPSSDDGVPRVTDVVSHGDVMIPILNAKSGTREGQTIMEGLQVVHQDPIRHLKRIEMVDGPILLKSGGKAAGVYEDQVIRLSRAFPGKVIWDSEDPTTIKKAKYVLWHEIGHLVYYRGMDKAALKEWRSLLPAPVAGSPPLTPGRESEIFADQFALHTAYPNDKTPMGQFFARFRA